jgi:hypothetical protein
MTQPGIGAAGIAGIAIEKLSPPVQAALATNTSGGTITAGTYRYVVTAINASGETIASNEQTIVTTGATSTVTVTWGAVTGATGYKLYKTAAGGASGTELLYKTVGLVVSDIDTSPGSPAGAFPLYNTAYAPGQYTAPTKFFPFMSESITMTEQTVFRRPIRQSADIIGAVAGNENPEGDMSLEALEDVVLYWLFASRTSIVKTGSTPNFTYTITPTAAGIPTVTLSLTVVRNGVVFGFTGVTLSSFTFTVEDGLLMFNTNIIARDEATQSTPVPTWTSTVPFGAGTYSVEIPTGSAVTDTDTFEWTVEDNAEAQFRLRSGTRGATFVKFGERNSTMNLERDFMSRTDFDAFKAVTAQSITITATKSVNNSISLLAPVAIKDTYEVSNSGQGDLVRATIAYQNVIDGTGKSWQIVIKCQEDLISA